MLQLLYTYAPPLQSVFETEALPLGVWPWLLLGGLIFFFVVEIEKAIIRATRSREPAVEAAAAVAVADLVSVLLSNGVCIRSRVIPAQAGMRGSGTKLLWMPAFAGMTASALEAASLDAMQSSGSEQ